jgi:two-component system, LytTR family, response regulator
MKVLSCIVIEDEPLAMERAISFVGKLNYLKLLASFDNGLDAMVYLKTHAVDLVFLDINLGDFSGIQLLESVKINSRVIFTTAYQDYAIKGYELNAMDYLLKPYTLERFIQAVEKVQDYYSRNSDQTNAEFIFVKTEYRLEKILLEDILYIEGMRDYRCIYTTQKRIMTLQTFKEFETILPESKILRVHKSYMVAINKIESIQKEEIKIKEKYIPVSETYKKPLMALLVGK